MLYSRNTNISGNIIKDNDEQNTLVYKNISLVLFSKRRPSFVVSWEIDGETYSLRDEFFPYLFSGSQEVPTLAPPCKLVRDASGRLRVPRSTAILCNLSKSNRVVLTWSPSCYTPVRPECPDALPFSCLLIKMWQLAKAYGVTRNEPNIHGICCITSVIFSFFIISLTLLCIRSNLNIILQFSCLNTGAQARVQYSI